METPCTDLWLVFELKDKPKGKGNRQRVYIVAPNYMQFYRTTSLHDRTHFQLDGEYELAEYISNLEAEGIVPVKPSDTFFEERRFYTILDSSRDHFLTDICIINDFSSPSLIRIIQRTRLEEWAYRLSDPNLSNVSDLRGCRNADIGFCAQSHNDPNVVQGMNAPRFTTKFDDKRGLDEDKSVTISMMETAIALRELALMISSSRSLNWDLDFGDDERCSMNSHRAAKERGLKEWKKFDVEGVTVGLTGETPDGDSIHLTEHEDTLNGVSQGYDVYYGFSSHFMVETDDFRPTLVRAQVGGYGKKCVCDFMGRYKVNKGILDKISMWKNNNPDLFESGPYLLRFDDQHDHRFIRPRADKAVYYSIFIEGILRLGEMCSYDLGVLYEAVFLLTLSPSPFYWYEGVIAAAKSRWRRNFAEAYIEYMVKTHGSVSGGSRAGRRRQQSHQGYLSRTNLYWSLVNMKTSNEASMAFSDGGEFLNLWAGPPEDGGIFGAGSLIAQEQIYLFAVLGELLNHELSLSGVVGRNTDTWTRLKKEHVDSETRVAELVRFLSVNMGQTPAQVENMLCEYFRDDCESKFDAKDTLIKGQGLFSLIDGVLLRMDANGTVRRVETNKWCFGTMDYSNGVRWWEAGFDPVKVEGNLLLTVKAKVVRGNKTELTENGSETTNKKAKIPRTERVVRNKKERAFV